MSRRTTQWFGADTTELDAAFERLQDELNQFSASIEAMSAGLGASGGDYRRQGTGDRGAARQWQSVDSEFGRDFSDVAMAAITGKRGGVGAVLAQMVERGLSQALAGIGRSLAGELQSALGLGGASPAGLLGSLFGSSSQGGGDVGQAAMRQLDMTMESMGLVTEGLDVTTAANTVATTANTAAESTGGAGGALGLAGILGFASGGRPAPGVASIVGERGPELFVPDSAGTVVPHGGWGLPTAPASPGITGGDFAPSISMPVTFHGGTAGMSKAEFRRMLGGNMDYLVGALKNLHRNAGRPLAR